MTLTRYARGCAPSTCTWQGVAGFWQKLRRIDERLRDKMKKILLILINFLTVFLGFSETFEVTVNKDTNYVDISKNTLDRIQKDTVLTIDSETVELGRYTLDENAEDARLFFSDKSLYIRDISVKNNCECLPTGIIGTTYTMNYYLQDILL